MQIQVLWLDHLTVAAPVPAIRKPPTFMERMTVSSPARFGKNLVKGIANIPAAGGYIAGEKVADALGIKDPVGQNGFWVRRSLCCCKSITCFSRYRLASKCCIGLAAYRSKNID